MEKFSVFAGAKITTNPTTISLEQAFNVIQKGGKDGKIKKLVERIQAETDKAKRNKLKEQLPCICFCGIFTKRSKNEIVNHSGLICLDFDGIPEDIFQDFYNRIITDKYTRMAFISPSGKGYKVVVSIPADIEKHEQYFQGLAEHYDSPYFDKATKDVSRVCYASYDEFAFLNLNSETFTNAVNLSKRAIPSHSHPQKTAVKMADSDALELIHRLTNKDILYAPGRKHEHLVKFAGMAINAGLEPEIVTEYYEQYHDKSDVGKIVSNLYKNYGATFGTWDLTASAANTYTANDSTPQQSYLTFWTVHEDKKGNIFPKFSRNKFLSWLKTSGWARFHTTEKDWDLVRIKSNIVSKQSKSKLKKFVSDYVDMLPAKFDTINKTQLSEMIMKGAAAYFSTELLDFLPEIEVSTHMDNATTCWLYYKNTAVKITKYDNECIQYKAINHKIWESQILDRDFVANGGVDNDFVKFVSIIAGFKKYGEDKELFERRMRAFETTIGYLLHGFKDRTSAKAVILNDAFNPSDDPRGGTGKGIFLSAIRAIKETEIEDGKIWTPEKSFAYQKIKHSTQVFAVDDVKKNFRFDWMFSFVTEGATIEKKGKDAFKIDFEYSPKLMILTNYPLEGEGSSHDRRRHELELDDFFILKNPIEHFGRSLFNDWSLEDWQAFDRYMIGCVRRFLNYGLIGLNTNNLKLRRLRELTHPVFVEWFTDFIEPKKYALRQLHDLLGRYNPDFAKYSQVRITRWIKKFAAFYNIPFVTGKMPFEGGSAQSIEFTNLGNLELDEVGKDGRKLDKVGTDQAEKSDNDDENEELPF